MLQVDEILFLDGRTHLLGIMQGDVFIVEVKTVREAFGIVKDRIDRRSEPLFDVPADQVTGKEEEQESGNEGKRDKEQNKLRFEMGSGDLPFSLKIELYQAAGKNKEQDEKKEKHDDLKGEKEHVSDGGRRKLLGLAEEKLGHEKQDDQSDHNGPQDSRTLSLCVFHFNPVRRNLKTVSLRQISSLLFRLVGLYLLGL